MERQVDGQRIVDIFIPLGDIPTVTAQEKGERIVGKKIVHYEKPEVASARELFTAHLAAHAPKEPFKKSEPLSVKLAFGYPWHGGKNGPEMRWRTTKPDADNMAKLFLDCMTRCKYWEDDNQVSRLEVTKLDINIDRKTADESQAMEITGIMVTVVNLPPMDQWDIEDWHENYCYMEFRGNAQ